jgi:hypothetical protein
VRRWLPSAIYFVAALCFFAAVLGVNKGHRGITFVFAVGGLLMVVIAITESRRQRRGTGQAHS